MLQIDHVYEFFSKTIFADYCIYSLPNGVYKNEPVDVITSDDLNCINMCREEKKIMFIDQEPLIDLVHAYVKLFVRTRDIETLTELMKYKMDGTTRTTRLGPRIDLLALFRRMPTALITSEKSKMATTISIEYNLKILYYFFHGFAAIDWFRGY